MTRFKIGGKIQGINTRNIGIDEDSKDAKFEVGDAGIVISRATFHYWTKILLFRTKKVFVGGNNPENL